MRPTLIAAITLAGSLALAGAAAARTPPAEEAAPPAKAAPPATPPGDTAEALEKSQGPEHAADVAKDRASPSSVISPDARTDVDASAKVSGKDDAAVTDKDDVNVKKKKHTTHEPAAGPSPEKPH